MHFIISEPSFKVRFAIRQISPLSFKFGWAHIWVQMQGNGHYLPRVYKFGPRQSIKLRAY